MINDILNIGFCATPYSMAHPSRVRHGRSSTASTKDFFIQGIDDLVHFDFMDPPAPETLMRTLKLAA